MIAGSEPAAALGLTGIPFFLWDPRAIAALSTLGFTFGGPLFLRHPRAVASICTFGTSTSVE